MKVSLIVRLLSLLCALSAAGGIAAETNGVLETFKRIESGTYAALRAGKVKVLGHAPDRERFGVAEQVEFIRLNTGYGDYLETIQTKVGAGELTYVSVRDTFYRFVLLNCAVQPLFLDGEKWEVWHMTGLGKDFSRCRSIGAGERRIGFGGVKGLADASLGWSFDFGDREKGLVVRFKAEGAW